MPSHVAVLPLAVEDELDCEEVAVEDEMDAGELVSTGTFQKKVLHHARVLDGSEDGTLVTFCDDDEKKSS
jgi:hypothetical protein